MTTENTRQALDDDDRLVERAHAVIAWCNTQRSALPDPQDVFGRVSDREYAALEARRSHYVGAPAVVLRDLQPLIETRSLLAPLVRRRDLWRTCHDELSAEMKRMEDRPLGGADGDRFHALRKSLKVLEHGTQYDYGAVSKILYAWFEERHERLFDGGGGGLNEMEQRLAELQKRLDAARREVIVRVERLEAEMTATALV